MELNVQGLYLCQFDITQGNSLLKYESQSNSTALFADLEYLSLPSGLHDISEGSDIVKFQILDQNKERYLSIARLYNNSKSIISDLKDLTSSIDRSKVKIFSIGLVFKLENNAIGNLSAYQESIIKQVDVVYGKFTQGSSTVDTILKDLSSGIKSLDKNLVWKEPHKVLKDIDSFIFPLWKQLILAKNILIVNKDSAAVGFDDLNRLVEYFNTISSSVNYNLVYNCSLSNFESVLLNSKGSYIAYTTDVILKDTVNNYQVILELDKNGKVTLLDDKNKPLHATFIESLKLVSKYKNDYSRFDGKGKSQKFIDLIYFIFTFNTVKPAYYKFVDMAIGIPLQAPLEPSRFEKWLNSLDAGIESLIKSSNNSKILTVKPSDVLSLGFDCFNRSDLLFLQNYITNVKFSNQVEKVVFKNFDMSLLI